jgi:hypothetical protein
MKFGTWDTHASRASVRDDPRGCPFAIFDFRSFPGAWKQNTSETPFYDSFFRAFKSYRSPALFEPNVWLWIVEQEMSTSVVQLYTSTMNLQYDLYHSTYIPAKTEGITVVQEARGVKQVGAIQLYFLTHKSSPTGRLPIKANDVFKKVYSLPPPHPKELVEETMYALYPAYELRMDFYIGILKAFTGMSETVYNVFGGTKFVYAALVSSMSFFHSSPNEILRTHVRKISLFHHILGSLQYLLLGILRPRVRKFYYLKFRPVVIYNMSFTCPYYNCLSLICMLCCRCLDCK